MVFRRKLRKSVLFIMRRFLLNLMSYPLHIFRIFLPFLPWRKSPLCSARVKEIQARGFLRLKIVITIYNNLFLNLWAKYVNLIPRWATFQLSIFKALANENTLLRTHCCSWCFLGCANWETFLADTKCFWTRSETFFVSRTQICVRNNVSATMCPRLPLDFWPLIMQIRYW